MRSYIYYVLGADLVPSPLSNMDPSSSLQLTVQVRRVTRIAGYALALGHYRVSLI